MKSHILRLVSAVMLMGIALAVCAAVVFSVGRAEAQSAAPRAALCFQTGIENTHILLYDRQDKLIQTLRTDADGQAVSQLLSPGDYRAETASAQAQIRLHDSLAVCVLNGNGSYDGAHIDLTGTKTGSLEICKPSHGSSLYIAYHLSSEEFEAHELLYDSAPGQTLSLTFNELPYGNYILTESGLFCCRITISEETPHVILSLP